MRLHFFQHVNFEGPGAIADWALARGHILSFTRFYERGWQLPDAGDYDFLVVMGGPMGVHDEALHPWLAAEKRAMREAINAGRKLLGVCLGAQLAAHVLGAEVRAGAQKEIGWFPLEHVTAHALIQKLSGQMAFHWHGDTFAIPEGGKHLLVSEACRNQAFVWREQVLGLQFHIELRAQDVEGLIMHGAAELAAGGAFVQPPEMLRQQAAYCDALVPVLYAMLDVFTAL